MSMNEEATREHDLNHMAGAIGPVEKLIPLAAITVIANPRSKYDRDDLTSLADSIERHGQIQAVVVRTGKSSGAWDLIAGTRRHRAFQILAERHPGDPRWTHIRASIQDHHVGSRLKAVQTIENIKRADLSTLELADAVLGLKADGLSAEQVAEELGYTKRHVDRLIAVGSAPEWLRAFAEGVEVSEPMVDEAGKRVVGDDGQPRFKTKRLPGFGFSDLAELLSFHRALDAWDRKQQDSNTAHRAKAEPETTRAAKKAAAAPLTGERLKAMLKSRLAELTGVAAPAEKGAAEKKKAYDISDKRIMIDVAALTSPLAADDLLRVKPDLTAALQRLGFTTIKLA